ncbi:MAG: hypothetical protein RLN89_10615 [Parvibaculum sp.]
MFKQWFHSAAIAAGLFSGMPYWREEALRTRGNPDALPKKAQ